MLGLQSSLEATRQADTQTTEDLRLSETRFRLLVQSIKDYAIYLMDPQGHIHSWNEGAQRLKGYTESEIVGRHFSIFYSPEDVASRLPERLLRQAEREGRCEQEGWRVRKDGTRFWANVVITALRDTAGHLVGFGKVTRDLTERMRAEEALRQSEERSRLMIGSVRDYAIFMLDPAGHVISWNVGAERIKGYREDEIRGKHFSVFYTPEDAAEGLPARLLQQAEREGRSEHEGWRVRRDGTRFWADVVISAVRGRDGLLVGFTKVTRDLTERRQGEEERLHLAQERAARQAAEEAVRMRDEFLGVAAHELKTPVTSLRLGAQLAARRLGRTDALDLSAVRRELGTVNQQAQKLAELVEKLLDVSRVANGRLALDPSETDLVPLVSDVVERLRALAPDRSFTLEAPESLIVRVDPLRLEQVVTNLLDNAVKYSSAGPIEVTVSRPAPDLVEVSVCDDGPGVPESQREHLFERFYQADTSSQRLGMGLGLSISRQIAQLHGGNLTAEFPLDGGSRFIVSLPGSTIQNGVS